MRRLFFVIPCSIPDFFLPALNDPRSPAFSWMSFIPEFNEPHHKIPKHLQGPLVATPQLTRWYKWYKYDNFGLSEREPWIKRYTSGILLATVSSTVSWDGVVRIDEVQFDDYMIIWQDDHKASHGVYRLFSISRYTQTDLDRLQFIAPSFGHVYIGTHWKTLQPDVSMCIPLQWEGCLHPFFVG